MPRKLLDNNRGLDNLSQAAVFLRPFLVAIAKTDAFRKMMRPAAPVRSESVIYVFILAAPHLPAAS